MLVIYYLSSYREEHTPYDGQLAFPPFLFFLSLAKCIARCLQRSFQVLMVQPCKRVVIYSLCFPFSEYTQWCYLLIGIVGIVVFYWICRIAFCWVELHDSVSNFYHQTACVYLLYNSTDIMEIKSFSGNRSIPIHRYPYLISSALQHTSFVVGRFRWSSTRHINSVWACRVHSSYCFIVSQLILKYLSIIYWMLYNMSANSEVLSYYLLNALSYLR